MILKYLWLKVSPVPQASTQNYFLHESSLDLTVEEVSPGFLLYFICLPLNTSPCTICNYKVCTYCSLHLGVSKERPTTSSYSPCIFLMHCLNEGRGECQIWNERNYISCQIYFRPFFTHPLQRPTSWLCWLYLLLWKSCLNGLVPLLKQWQRVFFWIQQGFWTISHQEDLNIWGRFMCLYKLTHFQMNMFSPLFLTHSCQNSIRGMKNAMGWAFWEICWGFVILPSIQHCLFPRHAGWSVVIYPYCCPEKLMGGWGLVSQCCHKHS